MKAHKMQHEKQSFMRPIAIAALILVGGCLDTPPEQTAPAKPDTTNSVWTVDLVRTLPGQQTKYLRNIEANWAGARRLARERNFVLSYRALMAPPDSSRGWDLLLMTEYADSTAWANREAIFQEIFASPEYVRAPTERPSSEVRAFFSGAVVMRGVVSDGSR